MCPISQASFFAPHAHKQIVASLILPLQRAMAEAMRRETWPFMVGFVATGAVYVLPRAISMIHGNVLRSFYKLHTAVSGE
jgi:hypothetical protein